jgi:uncharacterized membrane protein
VIDGSPAREPVLPTHDDPLVRGASEVVGGPAGGRVRPFSSGWWTPLRVMLVLVFLASLMGVAAKQHCRAEGWSSPDQFVHGCYSDVPLLFVTRGLADGATPYLSDVPFEQRVEYPVLSGAVMWLETQLVPGGLPLQERMLWFFDLNLLVAFLCLGGVVAATARTVRRRPWDAAMVAVAPGMVLASTINWDMPAVLFLALGLWAWSRRRAGLAGAFIGLGAAAKLYPLLVLGPLFILCLRAGRLREFWTAAGSALAAWLAVNVPVMVLNFEGWVRFYEFSGERGVSFSSIWYVMAQQGYGLPESMVNAVALLSFVVCCVGIAWIGLAAPRRPRFAQLAFLVVAAFVLANKVYSPQFVVWLIPLAVLARPRWRDFVIWQVTEVAHFYGIWLFLAGYGADGNPDRALSVDGYGLSVLAHILGTLWLVALVVRDILRPAHDPVRADGDDDPGGGALDGAADRFTLARPRRPADDGRPAGDDGSADEPVASASST